MDRNNTTDMPDIAQLVQELNELKDSSTHFFLCVMGCSVFLMQAGFAFLEAGSVRSKNTTNILIKNVLDSCIAAICYWSVGWAFAYGEPSCTFIGYGEFFAAFMEESKYSSWFFQYVFAATAATIVSGALAERCEFAAYFIYSTALTAFIYPVVTHWAWTEEGWLSQLGYSDFAGSGVVHLTGGTCALVGAALLGARTGRWDRNIEIRGHSVPFAALGGFILMFGFFAFNGGSQLQIHTREDGIAVALSMFNTMLAGASSALVMLGFERLFKSKKWSLLMTINAALAGMVAACCACNKLYPWGAVTVGCFAGLACAGISTAMVVVKVDDPIDAVAVHAGGGLAGLLISPWIMQGGIVFGGEGAWTRLGANALGALAIVVWSGGLIGIVFGALKYFKVFRVSTDTEEEGLDIGHHGEPSYPLTAYGHGWMHAVGGNRLAMQRLSVAEVGGPRSPEVEEIARRISVGCPPIQEESEVGESNGTGPSYARQRRPNMGSNDLYTPSPNKTENVTVISTD